jgi:hypothetical protein
MNATLDEAAVRFFLEHAGFSYDPKTETNEEGQLRCARDLAAAEQALRDSDELFIVWEEDDIDSSSFEETGEPRPLYVCLLCSEQDRRDEYGIEHPKSGEILIWDPRECRERSGSVVESVGGVDLAGPRDPYKRVIAAELMQEFEARRENMIQRGES